MLDPAFNPDQRLRMRTDVLVAPARPQAPVTDLLDVLPEFERAIPAGERPLARRAIGILITAFEPGPVTPPDGGSRPFACVVRSGLLLRRTGIASRTVVEILGPGDAIDLLIDDGALWPRAQTHLIAHERTEVAVLDNRYRLAARRWPELHDVLHEHLARQHRRTCRHLAVLSLPRVEDRIVAVFSDLADRFGRVTRGGITIDLPLTHRLIGELVASRRPTVTLALVQLASEGLLTRTPDGAWWLASEMPLDSVQQLR